MDETPNLLRTAPIRRPTDQGLTAFILEHKDDLHARREQGERAEDILPLVEQMLGRPLKLVTFASLLSRHVPLKTQRKRSTLTFEPPPERQIEAVAKPALRERAREPPPLGSDGAGQVAGGNHTEQPGVPRPIKAKLFIPKQS
jgi:hypothetical protein